MSSQEQCEWCERVATYRTTAGTYKRFACDAHVAQVDRLVRIDVGDTVRVVKQTEFRAGGFERNVRVTR